MKILSRDFTLKEKILLLVLSVLLLGIFYYYAIDRPVRNGIQAANNNIQTMQTEKDALDSRINIIEQMKDEIDSQEQSGNLSIMESYNNSKNEVNFINSVMAEAEDYKFSFDDLTRNGNQIRRYLSLEYVAKDYKTAKSILKTIEKCKYRIIISSVNVESKEEHSNISSGKVTVALNAVFFETLVDGEKDLALPEDMNDKQEENIEIDEYDF